MSMLLHGCMHDTPNTTKENNNGVREEVLATDTAAGQDTLSQLPEGLADVRRPDMKVRIRKGSALLLETEGFQLSAVDTAVRHAGVYSVTSLLEEDLEPLPQGMKNMTASAAGYRLLPGGEHFSPYAEVRVAYDPARLPEGYTADDIYTSYYDGATQTWVRLERLEVDTVNREIVSATTHFTDFINELLKSPEMPETQAFVPTALTDLEAVNPLDGITLIQPPTANNNGTANISYPLEIPQGRAGMQPNLALTYSSSGGDGWLGVGWDIAVPAITLDTRWGVPRYNPDKETEIYLLDGEQLITVDTAGEERPMPHRTNQQTDRLPDGTQFYARTGDAHDSIIRYGNSPKNYWWVVVDRNGITHYYGRYRDYSFSIQPHKDPNPIFFPPIDDGRLFPNSNPLRAAQTAQSFQFPQGFDLDDPAVPVDYYKPKPYNDPRVGFPATLCDDNGNIARWVLTESRDPYGNAVRYYYDPATVKNHGATGRQIYLDSISYTCHNNTDGQYTVVFCRTANPTTDIPMSCNNGFKEITDQVLNNVYVKYGDSILTIWHFEMENGDSTNFKNRLASVTKIDTVEEMGMRDLLNSFCHCIQPDEDEIATFNNDGAFVFMKDSIAHVLDTTYVPKYQTIQIKPNNSHDELNRDTNGSLYQYVWNNLRPSNCSDSIFCAILDSIYDQATYYGTNGYKYYQYSDGYEARVDTVEKTVFYSVSIPRHIRPNIKYAGATTTFEYYNAPSSGSLFSDEKTIDLEGSYKNLHGFFLSDPLSAFDDAPNLNQITRLRSRATGLGLSTSSGWNVGGAATVGLGAVVCLTNASVGGNYSRSGSSSETKMTLVDLDGDGLNDKVYVKGDKVYFCRQHWIESDSTFSFDEKKEIKGIHHIMRSSSTGNTFGVQAALYASAASSWTDSKSITSTYFADVNGDGLVDLVDGGQVYFNHCVKDSAPEFTLYSDVPATPQNGEGVIVTSNDCKDIIFDGAADDSIKCQRVWVLIDTFTTSQEDLRMYTWLNEHLKDTMYKLSLEDKQVDTTYIISQEESPLRVEVYHREWDCSYHDESPATDAVRVWIAPHEGTIEITSSIQLREDTSLSRSVSRHADGVVLTIQKTSTSNISHGDSCFNTGSVDTLLKIIPIDSVDYTMHVDSVRRLNIEAGDIIFFRLRSKSDYHFDDAYARFTINYTDSSNYPDSLWHFDSQEDFVLSSDYYFQAPSDGNYRVNGRWSDGTGKVSVVLEQNGNPVTSWSVGDTIYTEDTVHANKDDLIRVVLKSSDGSSLDWGQVSCSPYITFVPAAGDTVYNAPNDISDTITFSGTDTINGWLAPHVDFIHYNAIYDVPLYRRLFGPLYKGWGQFAYRSEGADADMIQVTKLVPPDMMVSGNTNDADREQMDAITDHDTATSIFGQSGSLEEFQSKTKNFYSPYSDSSSWVEMTPDAEHWAWVGYGHQNTVGRDTISNSLRTDWYSIPPSKEVYNPNNSSEALASNITVQTVTHDDPIPPSIKGTPAKAVNKVNRSESHSWSAGFIGIGASYSNGDNTIEIEYMDLNGDRYPDIIGTDKVQYSQQWGGVGPVRTLNSDLSHGSASHTNSYGASYSASKVTQERTTCSLQQNAFFTMHSEGSGSATGGGNLGFDEAGGSWVDINGDGLPDFVYSDGHVMLNIGYDFVDDKEWDFTDVHKGVSVAISVDVGLELSQEDGVSDFLKGVTNISQASIEAGVGMDGSYNQTKHMLMDINGDGLPDKLWREFETIDSIIHGSDFVKTMVSYNLGGGKFSDTDTLNIGRFHSSATFSESMNVGFTYGFTVWGFKVTTGVNACPYNASVTQDYVQLADVNADGLPDWVCSRKEDAMTVRYNKGGKTNLLKSATNLAGAGFLLDYTLSAPLYEQPSRSWNLTSVETYDPLNPNGGQRTITQFEYANPHYDRYERTSYGYDSVVTRQIDPRTMETYRYVARNYNNCSLLQRGKMTCERTYGISNGQDKLYIERMMEATMIDYLHGDTLSDEDCPKIAYPSTDSTFTRFYEGSDSVLLETGEKYEYDRYHNVIKYIDYGDFSDPADGLVVEFSYLTGQPYNLIGLRSEYKVIPTGSTDVARRATFEYNDHGKLTKQTLHNGTEESVYDFSYEKKYGNMDTAFLPENFHGERMYYAYAYDTTVHTYPIRINDAYNEHSTATYDLRHGKPLSVTDHAGGTMTYTYDFAGRLTSVNSPQNTSGTPSVVNHYYVANYFHNTLASQGTSRPYAVTEHFGDDGDTITRTVVITDGSGRVVQTKKGLTVDGTRRMQVSGRTIIDPFGRTITQYDPFTSPCTDTLLGHFFDNLSLDSTHSDYDILDRVTSTVQPYGITTRTEYTIKNDTTGHRRFYSKVTDPEGNVTHQYTDYDGHQVQVTDANGGITLMQYDNLGQLMTSTDPEGFTTSYGYDNLGHLVSREHPDAGITNYLYDPAGNLTKEVNPLGEINYDYTYYRPTEKRYGYMTGNDVIYTYGTDGEKTGRLISVVDGSGSVDYNYDALGNIIDETRTIAVPNSDNVYQFQMNYSYDSWGRMLQMTYPDGEKVNYTYQWGGDLRSMNGNNVYIDSIRYNPFGQRSAIHYGNGTHVEYTYDDLHRLVKLTSYTSDGTPMQQINYTFDNVSNVTSIVNDAGAVNSLGEGYKNNYYYDKLYRLTSSDGGGEIGNYNMGMGYTPSGRIIWKRKNAESVTLADDAYMHYSYCDDYQPHAVRHIFDEENKTHCDLRWDPAGNLGQISVSLKDNVFDHGRFLFWTVDNRMHAAVDDKHYSYYTYDYTGERRLKLTGESNRLDVNADFMTTGTLLNTPTLYPSAYLVLTSKGYTKHYYAGADRVAASLGGGGLKATGSNPGMQDRAKWLFWESHDRVNGRTLQETGQAFPAWEYYGFIKDIPGRMKASVEFYLNDLYDNLKMLAEEQHQEKDVYFYHSDHLGSASWITDADGKPIQHLQYLPFGEPFVNQHLTDYQERYLFTGKERDEETGYGYFGARYMDHELTAMWLSVDPMADKYPSISPYAYCAWNPIKLVDPDGRDVWELTNDGKLNWVKSSKTETIKIGGKSIFSHDAIFGTNNEKGTVIDLSEANMSFGTNQAQAEMYFEFFADNLNYEFSLLGSENAKGKNEFEVTTSLNKTGDTKGSHRARDLSVDNKLKIHVHNHPDNYITPSSPDNKAGIGDDLSFWSEVSKNSPDCKFYIYTKERDGYYVPYDAAGIASPAEQSRYHKPQYGRRQYGNGDFIPSPLK